MGGQESIRGYLVQTIICVLDAFNEENNWNAVVLEPDVESEKVDIIWYYSNPTKCIVDQVKSSKNQISIPQIKRWSKDLEDSIDADEYNVILIGPVSNGVSKTRKQGNVVLKIKNLDLDGLINEAANKLGSYMENKDYKPLASNIKEIVIKSLVTQFEIYSTKGKEISREEFDEVLFKWISEIAPESIKKKIFDILIEKGFVPYDNWGEFKNISKPKRFIMDKQRTQIIKEIRERLRNLNDETPIIRISGLPGVGKRRLVFEILSPPELNRNAYFINSRTFKDSNLISKILSDKELELTLIINECNSADHNEYEEILGNQGPRITIITISDEIEQNVGKPLYYLLKSLSIDDLKEILLSSYVDLPQYLVERFSEFSEGFPKFALDLALRHKENPSEYTNIVKLTDRFLLNKFIAGNLDINSVKFENTKRVLMGIALFKRVGYKDRLLAQAKWVCNEISRVEWEEFQLIVKEQRERGIIEGYYYLRINPFLLETYLYCEWWETYGNFETIRDFQDFIERFPVHLDIYFYDNFFYDVFISRFTFISHSNPGKELIRKMLSSGSLLDDKEIMKQKRYIDLLCILVESNIDLGIKFLKNMLNSWSNEDLVQFIEGRNEFLWLLEKLAFREEYFEEAALLLLRLAETHPIRSSYENFIKPLNNSVDYFVKIFAAVWGEAPPDKKYDYLVRLYRKSKLNRRDIILWGFSRALTTIFRWEGWAESLGNLLPPNIWNGTWDEIYQYHIKIWNFLYNLIEKSDQQQKLDIINILDSCSRELLSKNYPELNEIILNSFEEFASNDWMDKLELLAKVSSIIRYEGRNFTDEELARWIQLKQSLIPTEFKDELKIFLSWIYLTDLDPKYEDQAQIEIKLKELANKILNKPELLREELNFLYTKGVFRAFEFGRFLGEFDGTFSLKDYILDFFKDYLQELENTLFGDFVRIFFEGNISLIDEYFEMRFKRRDNVCIDLIAGYLSVLYHKNAQVCERLIIALSKIESCQYFVPLLVVRVCPNDNMINLVMELIIERVILVDSLSEYRFFSYPRFISEEIFEKWIKFLMEELPNSGFEYVVTSLMNYYNVLRGDKQLPRKITLMILRIPIYQKGLHKILDFNERMDQNNHISFYKEIAKRLVEQYPETAEDLFDLIIEFNMSYSYYMSPFADAFNEILTFFTQNYSDQVWAKIEKILELTNGPKFSFIISWLIREERGSFNIELFDTQNIIDWIKKDLNNRAKMIASIMPKKKFYVQNNLSRLILEKFGDQKDVREAFTRNFHSGRIHVYLPETTNPYQVDKEWLLGIYENENNENIKKWILEYIENYLDHDIERANTQKERKGRYGF